MSKDQRRTGQVSASVRTERLALRPFGEDDFKAVRSYLGDPQVMRYVDDPYSDKQVKRFLSRWVGDDPPVLALVRRDKDKVVGHVVFHRYEHPDVYEISWVLHPKYHSRGYATEAAEELRSVTLEIYRKGQEIAAGKGIIIADTKIELGYAKDGTLKLGDELLTPDSSRFWSADEWKPGSTQRYLDKQFLRDWSSKLDWDRTAPGPEVPEEVVEATRSRYVEAYERLTGESFADYLASC